MPVIHVVHESRRPNPTTFAPGSPALEIHPAARPAPGEPVLTKHLPGSFTNTALEEHLRRHGIEQVIVSGFMTQMCCDTTAREAAHRGFKVLMAADAMAAMSVKGPDGRSSRPRAGAPDASRQPERLPGDGDHRARADGAPPGARDGRAPARAPDDCEQRPPASPPTAPWRLAPRAGLEPATLWLQVPPRFRGAWTISSP